jgi:hypothetical protein
MAKKFGGEYESKDVENKTSTLEARKLFLELVLKRKRDVVLDLTKLFDFESIPVEWQKSPEKIDFCTKLFLSHSESHNLYSYDISEFGFNSNVRNTLLLAYFDFIFKKQTEFRELLAEKEKELKDSKSNFKPELIVKLALTEMVPDWKSLQATSGSRILCESLIKWSEKWNLMDDWCLDFALNCLRNCKVYCTDKLNISKNYVETDDLLSALQFNSFWQSGKAWSLSLIDMIWGRTEDFGTWGNSKDFNLFEYIWKQDTENGKKEIFKITEHYNPFVSTADKFRRRLEEQFWEKFFNYYSNHRGAFILKMKSLTQELENFQNRVEIYMSRNEDKVKPFANKSITKRDNEDKHFKWLVDYQIPPVKDYKDLAEKNL